MKVSSYGKFFLTVAVSVGIIALSGCWPFGKCCTKDAACATQASQVILVNVLDKEFFEDCHIPGSLHVPIAELEEQAKNWEKDKTVVVYCSNYSCTASCSANKALKRLGFADARAYEAGMAGWVQAKLPFEGPAQADYLTLENKPLEGPKCDDVTEITTEELQALLGIEVAVAADHADHGHDVAAPVENADHSQDEVDTLIDAI